MIRNVVLRGFWSTVGINLTLAWVAMVCEEPRVACALLLSSGCYAVIIKLAGGSL